MAARPPGRRASQALGWAALLCCAAVLLVLPTASSLSAWLAQPVLAGAAAPIRTTVAPSTTPTVVLATASACLGQQRPLTCAAAALAGGAAVAAAIIAAARAPAALPRQVRVSAGPACLEDGATDPSLFVTTNIAMGDQKRKFMQAASKAVAKCLGKPESYVAVCVQDGQDIIWGGDDAPCALCKVLSLGSINLENNKALTVEVSGLLAEFNVPQNRIYVNFFDLERQNVGYNGATFAG